MGKKDISHQKKFETRIDFTPMVDMNMLLITFFMLCTTMLKSQTLKIALPSNSNESKVEKNQNQAAESQAFTIIIDGEEIEKDGNFSTDRSKAKFFFYEGKLAEDFSNLEEAAGISGGAEGKTYIRKKLEDKNKEALREIDALKKKWEKNEFAKDQAQNDSIYQAEVNKVLITLNEARKTPIVMIKPTSRSSYADVIAALDEMQINHIGTFQIETLSKQDSTALASKGVTLPKAPVTPKKGAEAAATK